jgi:hypothetical protein
MSLKGRPRRDVNLRMQEAENRARKRLAGSSKPRYGLHKPVPQPVYLHSIESDRVA